ncbi:MAG TPA: SDR family oxidoreductase [Nocardioidaceae bacterium]|nr:SDR family oxidoreductase [Nocardioidaceae bacterium]
MSSKVIVVVGAGPGVGASVARRFGREGYDVALVARSADRLDGLGAELQAAGVTTGWTPVDITDAAALTSAVTRFGEHAGRIDVLHFNPSAFRPADPLHLTAAELLEDLSLGVGALLTAVQAARPFMSSGARVTATGSLAADHPSPAAASLGVQKAALRNLVLSLDRTLASDGIRAMSLTVNGTLAPDTAFSPDRVADAIYTAAVTADESWRAEVPYDG